MYGGRQAGRAAAETFRADPRLDTATVILELAIGEVLVSVSGGRRCSPLNLGGDRRFPRSGQGW